MVTAGRPSASATRSAARTIRERSSGLRRVPGASVSPPEARPAQLAAIEAALGPGARADGRAVIAPAPGGLASLAAAVTRLEASGAAVHQAGLEHPTLDELFGQLTGDRGADSTDPAEITGTRGGGPRRLETTSP